MLVYCVLVICISIILHKNVRHVQMDNSLMSIHLSVLVAQWIISMINRVISVGYVTTQLGSFITLLLRNVVNVLFCSSTIPTINHALNVLLIHSLIILWGNVINAHKDIDLTMCINFVYHKQIPMGQRYVQLGST